MGKYSWEYRNGSKTYRVTSLTEINSESKWFIINRAPILENDAIGEFKEIKENEYEFIWKKDWTNDKN